MNNTQHLRDFWRPKPALRHRRSTSAVRSSVGHLQGNILLGSITGVVRGPSSLQIASSEIGWNTSRCHGPQYKTPNWPNWMHPHVQFLLVLPLFHAIFASITIHRIAFSTNGWSHFTKPTLLIWNTPWLSTSGSNLFKIAPLTFPHNSQQENGFPALVSSTNFCREKLPLLSEVTGCC